MQIPIVSGLLGENEFVLRRWHSLTGLIPIGGFLCMHLATNASILDGGPTFQSRVNQIHSLGPGTLLFLEWAFIFLPILFHGMVGLVIVSRGKRNVWHYPYSGNVRYTLQRITGVIILLFVLFHVFHMRGWFHFSWWTEHVTHPLGGGNFNPEDAAQTATAAIRASWIVFAVYAIGTLAAVYHLADGLWTLGITWGVWTSPRAQQKALKLCGAFGLLLGAAGIGALAGMQWIDVSNPPEAETATASAGEHAGTVSEALLQPVEYGYAHCGYCTTVVGGSAVAAGYGAPSLPFDKAPGTPVAAAAVLPGAGPPAGAFP